MMKSRPDLKNFSKYKHPKKQSFLFYILLPIQWKIWTKLDIENLIFTNFKTFLMPNPKFQSTGELLCKPYQINWLGTCVQWLPSLQQPEKQKEAISAQRYNSRKSCLVYCVFFNLVIDLKSIKLLRSTGSSTGLDSKADQDCTSNVKITHQTYDFVVKKLNIRIRFYILIGYIKL